jgi:putative transcriptional regulator
MRDQSKEWNGGPETGSLLVAHPAMADPNFKKSVVFLTAHSQEGGSLGVVFNSPLDLTLGEFNPHFSGSALARLPVYRGGPVAQDKLILAAWKWVPGEGVFQFFFGIDEEKARELHLQGTGFQLCGFVGHAGWGKGQLRVEIEEGAWVVSRRLEGLEPDGGKRTWREILCRENPMLGLLADAPEDPSLN